MLRLVRDVAARRPCPRARAGAPAAGAPPKRQIRLPAVSTTVRPGAPASRRCSHAMRSPSSNVGAGTRASASRSSRASSAALTPRGRYQAARRPGWPPPAARTERGRGLDRRVDAETEVAGLRDQHHVLDGVRVVEPLLDAERGDRRALRPEVELHLRDAGDRAHLPDREEHLADARRDIDGAQQIGLVDHASPSAAHRLVLEGGLAGWLCPDAAAQTSWSRLQLFGSRSSRQRTTRVPWRMRPPLMWS